jgi:hypothetical protein
MKLIKVFKRESGTTQIRGWLSVYYSVTESIHGNDITVGRLRCVGFSLLLPFPFLSTYTPFESMYTQLRGWRVAAIYGYVGFTRGNITLPYWGCGVADWLHPIGKQRIMSTRNPYLRVGDYL